jgi:hypothetical protein
VTDVDAETPSPVHYRALANSVRNLIPLMEHAEVRERLSRLALQYERLAEGIEAVSESLRISTAPDCYDRQRLSST